MGKRAKFEDWIIVDRLADIILSNVKGCIVEIGIGISTVILSGHARDFKVKHYVCDSKESRCDWFRDQYGDRKDSIVFNEESVEFMKSFDDEVALLFIDGDHHHENVIKEAEFFIDKLVPGGVGFFHDMYVAPEHQFWYEKGKKPEATTYKARLKMEQMKDIWCLTFPYTAQDRGLTMILKKEKNRPYYRL